MSIGASYECLLRYHMKDRIMNSHYINIIQLQIRCVGCNELNRISLMLYCQNVLSDVFMNIKGYLYLKLIHAKVNVL